MDNPPQNAKVVLNRLGFRNKRSPPFNAAKLGMN